VVFLGVDLRLGHFARRGWPKRRLTSGLRQAMAFNGRLKIGLKLWSTDAEQVAEASKHYRKHVFDYIELYVVTGTYTDTIKLWCSFPGSYVVHCPHASHGFNLAMAKLRKDNQRKFEEVQTFANELGASTIIVHPGNGGPLEESIRQLNNIADKRICIENKPREGLNGRICVGSTPQEIQRILQGGRIEGFVLDFNHAVCAANTFGISIDTLITDFLDFKPRIFHLSDGSSNMTKDEHCNLGAGSLDLSRLVSYIPQGEMVTLETPRAKDRGLEDFTKDVEFLRTLVMKHSGGGL
jgi:deoxyribonuclease-4